jgi:hypothetical protein
VRFEGGAPFVPVKIFLAVTLLVLTSGLSISRWRQREVLWNPATTVICSNEMDVFVKLNGVK